jgi:hypothetical protein
LLGALGVFGTGTGWPDTIVAAIMGRFGLAGGQILRHARGELRTGLLREGSTLSSPPDGAPVSSTSA